MGHPWDNAVDSDTDVALSSNRHGIGAGGFWNVPGRRAFGLVLPENAEPLRMVGAAVKAGPEPEALEGAGGLVGTAATFVACVSPELLP